MPLKHIFNIYALRRSVLILLILIGGNSVIKASDDFIIHSYQVENGLSHNTVWCALQDSYGFIWFGTGNGLNCFDGRENTVYRSSSQNESKSLGSNLIHSLFEDKEKQIWIGTDCGIYIYNRNNQFSVFDRCTKFGVSISSEVSKITQLPNGIIWIATLGQGLFFYDPKTDILTQDNRYSSFIWDMCTDEQGHIYTSSLQKGVLCFDANRNFLHAYPLSVPHEKTQHSYKANCILPLNGSLWVGTDSKYIFRIDTDGYTYPYEVGSDRFRIIHSLMSYGKNRLLVGTDNGVYLFDCKSGYLSAIGNELSPNFLNEQSINAFMKDAEGGIWILTHTQGVTHISQRNKPFSRISSPECKMVNTFCEDRDGRNMWVGLRNGLFVYNSKKEFKKYIYPNGHNKHFDYDIRTLCLNNDELWIGTFANGLKVLNMTTGKLRSYHHSYNIPNTICSDEVQKIYRCRNGQIYIGTSWGLCYYNPEENDFSTEKAIGVMISITDIYEDSHNNIWIATANNGIFLYNRNNESWRHYEHKRNDPHSISHNSITTLFEDKNGTMWFGTNGNGLCSFDEKTKAFIEFDSNDSWLSNRIIYAIEQDLTGDLWVSSNTGLIRLNPSLRKRYQHFTDADGLQGNQFNERASWRSQDGTLYFGGTYGFNSFQPSLFQNNTYMPPVYITKLTFTRTDKHEDTYKNQPLYLTQQIKIPYTRNSFTIHFAALSYQDPDKNHYSYKLEGIDESWFNNTENNSVSYTNLAPGKYHLLVRGSNNDLKWNEQTAELWIIITPPWWQSVWAYIVYAVLSGCIIAYLLWRRDQHIKNKYHKRMKEYQAEKEKELYKSKVNFFINIVHEIRTPLSLIKLPLEKLMNTSQDKYDNKYLSVIDKNVNYLLGVTNELLDFPKMESGCIRLHLKKYNVNELLENIYQQFSGSADLGNITLSLHIPEGLQLEAMIDYNKINKILVNLLSNAMKYAHSHIDLSLTKEKHTFTIRVEDDGPGIADHEKEKIFEVFYQINEPNASLGSGIGLAYSRSLAESHNGTLTVADNVYGGSSFVLTLSLSKTQKESEASDLLPDNKTSIIHQAEYSTKQDPLLQQNYTVLLVEDNADLLEMTYASLKQWFKVLKAKNGVQAMQIISTNKAIDIMVSDIMMPQMNGLELCEKIKNSIEFSHIPIILLTAKILPESKAEGFLYGADAYMEKPFTITQLCMQIRNILKLRILFHQRMQSLAPQEAAALSEEFVCIGLKDQEFIERMQQIIGQQLADENFSIDTLAAEMNMSRSNFYRKLKALTGMPPNEYLKICRLNKAARLLKEGARINEVFEQTGFGSSSYFAKCFKAQFGVLPKEYAGEQPNIQI